MTTKRDSKSSATRLGRNASLPLAGLGTSQESSGGMMYVNESSSLQDNSKHGR